MRHRLVVTAFALLACNHHSGTTTEVDAPAPPPDGDAAIDANGAIAGAVTPDFFGIHVNQSITPWPTAPFGGFRSLSSQIMWANINKADGAYDWTKLDAWLAKAASGGQDVLYTVYATPPWASSNLGANGDDGSHCGFDDATKKDFIGPGICDAPSDLAADGTGTDQHFIDFVTALVAHAGGRIKYYELWNEPNITTEWNGTNAQMLRMARDLYTIVKAADPSALVTTPASTATIVNPPNGNHWLDPYLRLGGGDYADIVAFHGYVLVNHPACGDATMCIDPEDVDSVIDAVTTVAAADGAGAKPVFDTEGSWGGVQPGKPLPTDPDLQAAYVARFYLIQLGRKIARFYWFAWDIPSSGYFYDPATKTDNTAALGAYEQLHAWAIGNAFAPCSASGTIWTCAIVGPSGYQALAVWDAAGQCHAGTCTTTAFTVPAGFTAQHDLSGSSTPVTTGEMISIGAKPSLLDNR